MQITFNGSKILGDVVKLFLWLSQANLSFSRSLYKKIANNGDVLDRLRYKNAMQTQILKHIASLLRCF